MCTQVAGKAAFEELVAITYTLANKNHEGNRLNEKVLGGGDPSILTSSEVVTSILLMLSKDQPQSRLS